MATVEKIRRDIEKTREKISEQQKRLRTLETQLTEEENLEIVRMVKAVKMDNRELTAFLKAYASGLITLPEGMMEAEAAADPGENEMEENLEIVRMVKAVKMDNRELTAFLKAYASGLITLPDGMMEAEAAADPGDEDMEDSENEE